jgi:hypothetical protein
MNVLRMLKRLDRKLTRPHDAMLMHLLNSWMNHYDDFEDIWEVMLERPDKTNRVIKAVLRRNRRTLDERQAKILTRLNSLDLKPPSL